MAGDSPTDIYAPGGDPLAYLRAARDLRFADAELPADAASGGIRRIDYAIDGPAYARYMRDTMEAQLKRSGEMPAGLNLSTPQRFRDMQAEGELWVDAAGLPVRQVIRIAFPEEPGRPERLDVTLVTAFHGWDAEARQALLSADASPLAALTRLGRAGLAGLAEGSSLPMLSLLVGMTAVAAFALVTRRRSRVVYRAVVISVTASMLFGPLIQGRQALAFTARQAAREEGFETAMVPQDAAGPSDAALTSEQPFDPHRDPLAERPPEAGALPGPEVPRMWLARLAEQSRPQAVDALDSCTVNGEDDTDCDGLSDLAELAKLGTDPTNVDTDGDNISDRAEVEGFDMGGLRWYLDPKNFDSNEDGLIDHAECPELVDVDADGNLMAPAGSVCRNTDTDLTPDVYDFDNDADGVPDDVDSSPNYDGTVTQSPRDAVELSVDGYTAGQVMLVDFEIVPEKRDYLWLATRCRGDRGRSSGRVPDDRARAGAG